MDRGVRASRTASVPIRGCSPFDDSSPERCCLSGTDTFGHNFGEIVWLLSSPRCCCFDAHADQSFVNARQACFFAQTLQHNQVQHHAARAQQEGTFLLRRLAEFQKLHSLQSSGRATVRRGQQKYRDGADPPSEFELKVAAIIVSIVSTVYVAIA